MGIDPGIEGCDTRVSGPGFIYPSRAVMNIHNSTLCGCLERANSTSNFPHHEPEMEKTLMVAIDSLIAMK